MTMSITARTVIDGVSHVLLEAPGPLIVLWLQLDARRTEMRAQILADRQTTPIVPIVLRGEGFQNANALLCDLMTEIEKERESFVDFQRAGFQKIAVVLLSLHPLAVPQVSSPARLPDWFPISGGEVVEVHIRDLTRSSNTALNAYECKISEIAAGLHRIEAALLKRLYSQANKNPSHSWGASFFDRIKDEKKNGESYRDFLKGALAFNHAVVSPEGYRPSARSGESLLGRLMRMVSSASPDELGRRAKSLSEALVVSPETKVSDSLVSVLFRPTIPPEESVRLVRNTLLTIYAASQYVTAAAHADAYPMYSLPLLQGLSFELRSTLERLTQALDTG